MKRRGFARLISWMVLGCAIPVFAEQPPEIHLAVEFVDHAACAHIARHLNWYEEAGLTIRAFDSYITGMAMAAALSRGGIDAAYVCLLPAVNARANAKVPIKIVAGTHRYGYGLIVRPEKIKTIQDLTAPGIRLGCTAEGSPPAALLHKLVDRHQLDASLINRARRMPPPKLLLALQTGRIDAAFMPEQFPSMAEAAGFKSLCRAEDLWPGMQGSVLVVTEDLLRNHPAIVRKLVQLTKRGIQFIRDDPEKAAQIVADELNGAGQKIFPADLTDSLGKLSVSQAVIYTSLTTKMENTAEIDPQAVQEAIDYAAQLGYIKQAFAAEEILETTYLHE